MTTTTSPATEPSNEREPSPPRPVRRPPVDKSVVGAIVGALCVYAVVAAAINHWLQEDVLPSPANRVPAVSPRGIARTVVPRWMRVGMLMGFGLVAGTVAGRRRAR